MLSRCPKYLRQGSKHLVTNKQRKYACWQGSLACVVYCPFHKQVSLIFCRYFDYFQIDWVHNYSGVYGRMWMFLQWVIIRGILVHWLIQIKFLHKNVEVINAFWSDENNWSTWYWHVKRTIDLVKFVSSTDLKSTGLEGASKAKWLESLTHDHLPLTAADSSLTRSDFFSDEAFKIPCGRSVVLLGRWFRPVFC